VRIRDKNKLAHEKSVADELLDVLRIKPLGSRQGNPGKKEPDRIYRIDKKTIGIEVVTAYYSDEEAKATAEAAAEKPIAEEIMPGETIGSPDDSMCDPIKECVEEKCKKVYSGADETWLCINADATITESAVIEKCAKSLKIPKHGFTRLFVTQRKSANEGGGLIVIEFK
jgi:hypothetical protein